MQINRLRLIGFKSFVEPTDLLIENGLTGVVGPNGCGKSNLLEALRWVMGETSHKSMRAAAMDDVIFSGTTARPARNGAEVTIFIDNSARSAPAAYNDHDIIEITRRIEREAGSVYRVNGREVRARDVKILFEDAATGARSPALVRQGQIAEIVNAKPEQRRRILEDAAGIAGLHSRRHEAELRLRAAEGNMARLSDIIAELASQVDGLKRQARQARRYREISTEIRRCEALALYLAWSEAQASVEAEEAALREALVIQGAATEAEATTLRAEADVAASLQPLRENEAVRGAVVARLKIEQTNLEREAERAAARQRELQARVGQLSHDREREATIAAEATDALAGLDDEMAELIAADAGAAVGQEEATAALAAARTAEGQAERLLADLTRRAYEIRSRLQSMETSLAERRSAAAKVASQHQAIQQQIASVASAAPDATRLTELQNDAAELAETVAAGDLQLAEAEERTNAAALRAAEALQSSQQARLAAHGIETEVATLTRMLQSGEASNAPVLDSLTVAPGFEVALGAALGDDLDAPVDAAAPMHWRLVEARDSDPALPTGVEPLASNVRAPPELARRLAQVGIVARKDGATLQVALAPGQRLVSREGDLWRWDGYVAAAEAPTTAAQRLALKNRLAELQHRLPALADAAATAQVVETLASEARSKAEDQLRKLRIAQREQVAALARTQSALGDIEHRARETESRLATLRESEVQAQQALEDATARIIEIETILENADRGEALAEEITAAEAALTVARTHSVSCANEQAAVARERQLRAARLAAARTDRQRWADRARSAGEHMATLETRLVEARAEVDGLASLPAEIDAQRQRLLTALTEAEGERSAAADALAVAESTLREAQQALKAAQAAVGEAREQRARIEAWLESQRNRRSEEARRIREAFSVAPEDCLAAAGVTPGPNMPAYAEVDRQLTRLKSDRERLGGINLQAEEELAELEKRYSGMAAERADVEDAIAKLRNGISQLNREARKRLADAFTSVDQHFRNLFTILFNGGEARLEMIEGDDPLEGGLEIIAKPPGKKPATLSLLSGGEQTLTALSLIFAVFLTNPSPVCVLDEVDAPLDDANVDRFCTMMERMAADTATRFLIITHHPMTMSRMNRLFGVTMAEKGISQLVSVDLATAEQFVSEEPAQRAAG